MHDLLYTMKLHLHVDTNDCADFVVLTERYAEACNYVSQYIFDHHFLLNYVKLHDILYEYLRSTYGLKAQMAQSVIKTVIARYKAVRTQFKEKPYIIRDEDGNVAYSFKRNLNWMWEPICFSRPQADLVRGRDYSFVNKGTELSLNTLNKRIKVSFDVPEYYEEFFDGSWKFGTGKILQLKGEWYFHIPMTKQMCVEDLDHDHPAHIVGIDRGIRFLMVTYDENGKSHFFDGKEILARRNKFNKVRAELQSRGTKSAKRVLKRLSGRENRWMSDVNHKISKALVDIYGSDTLFVVEDLTDVSFTERNVSRRRKKDRDDLRKWAFYELEQFLTYKSRAVGSDVVKVDPAFTSQRCPKCGCIRKENRHKDIHEYICSDCGYRSNDDRAAAMNIYQLGVDYVLSPKALDDE